MTTLGEEPYAMSDKNPGLHTHTHTHTHGGDVVKQWVWPDNLCSGVTDLVLECSLRSYDLVEDMLANMRVHSTERIVQEVHICILINSTGQTHTLFLPAT